jgi:hypothetical protein
MKFFSLVFSLVFFLLTSVIALAQEARREATKEEIKYILPKGSEEKLRSLGESLAKQSENSVIEKALIQEVLAKKTISQQTMKDYIQHLTNQGMEKSEIEIKIEKLTSVYFAELQIKNLDTILPEEKQKSYEARFDDLQKRHQEGNLSHDELDEEISKLESVISASEITKRNEHQADIFKNNFLSVARNNSFSKSPLAINPKLYTPIKVMVLNDFSFSIKKQNTGCEIPSKLPTTVQMEQLKSQLDTLNKPLFHQVWFAWGYNRDYHSKTDVKFTTKDGTFVIHDAVGYDRQSPISIKYLSPTKLTIPQYNLEIGVMFNEKWGMDFHMDHMKYVFDNSPSYEITGDYNHQVVTNTGPVSFSTAAANHDASWLRLEHTNGYNYASVGAVYNQNLFETKKKKFAIDARFGAGAGLMIPKTEVWIMQDQPIVRYGIDNKFHIAGAGVHGDMRLKLTFWNSIFLQASTRATYIKIKNALVDGADARIEHLQPMGSFQIVGQIGYQYTFDKKKKKKRP